MSVPSIARAVFVAALCVVVVGAAGSGGVGPLALSGPVALAIGIALALAGLTAFEQPCKVWARVLMQTSIVLLGFSIPFSEVLRAGLSGLGLTLGTVLLALAAGVALGRLLRVETHIITLLTAGTAICGGSAIIATGAAIRASAAHISLATAIVFLLNAGGVYAYPPLGRWMGLSEIQFGTWAGIGIHDTAGVVAAGKVFGPVALDQATIVKLTRVLWIVPVALALAAWTRRQAAAGVDRAAPAPGQRPPGGAGRSFFRVVPFFILMFLLACLLRSTVPALVVEREWLPGGASVAASLRWLGKALFTVALFLIGTGLSRKALAAAGWRPLVLGVVLWLIVSVVSLVAVLAMIV